MTALNKFYSDPQFTNQQVVPCGTIGGNASATYYAFVAPVACQLFAAQATVITANAAGGGNVTINHISANNGSNTYASSALANIAIGVNLNGNTVASGALSSSVGGVSLAAGDLITITTDAKSNGTFSLALMVAVAPAAALTA